MSIYDYQNPIISQFRDVYIDITESHQIVNNKVILSELPSEFSRVLVSGNNITWIETTNSSPQQGQYYVDYTTGVVTFNSVDNGLTLQFSFKGRGLQFFPISRIWTQENNGEVLETLQDVIDITNQVRENAQLVADTLTFIGDWNAETAYKKNNIVQFDNEVYVAIKDNDNIQPPNETNWKLYWSAKNVINNAITATNNINTSINNANLATKNANEKASLAQQKADTAQVMADYAQQKGDEALQVVQDYKIIPKTPVANFAAIATTYPTATVNWLVQTEDDGKFYRYNGSTWEYHSKLQTTQLTPILNQLSEQNKATTTLSHGTTIIPATQSSPLKVEFYGQTLVNVLGEKGNCEDKSKFTMFMGNTAEITVSTTQKTQGTSSLKFANSNSNNHIGLDNITLDASKYYIAMVDVFIESFTSGNYSLGVYDAGGFTNGVSKNATTSMLNKFQTLFVKFTGKSSARLAMSNGTLTTGVAYFDGLRLYSVSADLYNKIGVLFSDQQVADMFPYVDGIQNVYRPYVLINNGSYLYADCVLAGNDAIKDKLYDINYELGKAKKEKYFETNETLTLSTNTSTLSKNAVANTCEIVDTTTGDVYRRVATLSGTGKEFTQSGTDNKTITFNATALPTTPVTQYQLSLSEVNEVDIDGDLYITGDVENQITIGSSYSYTTNPDTGERTYTLTSESERYNKTSNATTVNVFYEGSLKSSVDANIAKTNDVAIKTTINTDIIIDLLARIKALESV